MSMLLLFITVLMVIFSIIRVSYALKIGARKIAFKTTAGMLIWLTIYFTMLLTVSLTSNEKVLPLNREKHFCGCYFDCHLAASVTNVEQTKQLGEGTNIISAKGIFYIVTIKINNDARHGTIGLKEPLAIIDDEKGQHYQRDLNAENLLSQDTLDPFTQPLPPSTFGTKRVVFDLPVDVTKPYLSITEGGTMARFSELFLISDEDSLYHKPTRFQLLTHAKIIFTDKGAIS